MNLYFCSSACRPFCPDLCLLVLASSWRTGGGDAVGRKAERLSAVWQSGAVELWRWLLSVVVASRQRESEATRLASRPSALMDFDMVITGEKPRRVPPASSGGGGRSHESVSLLPLTRSKRAGTSAGGRGRGG